MTNTDKIYDVAMIGAGPATLSAAIYTTREDLSTVAIEKGVVGGLAAITDKVDNYPGFPDGVTGEQLADNLWKQAERFGMELELGEVSGVSDQAGVKVVQLADRQIRAKAVLIATGSDYKKLGIPGEKEYYGKGVHYCATCDGPLYRGKKLVVVGGGNSAIQESIFLAKFADHIDVLVRGDSLKASEILQKDLEKHQDKITIRFQTTTDEIIGQDGFVKQVKGTNLQTKQAVELDCDGVFVFIGLVPNSGFLANSLKLDERGFIVTDQRLMTSIDGVFAAGDVRSGATMQIASAVGEGATAALMIREYLAEHARKI